MPEDRHYKILNKSGKFVGEIKVADNKLEIISQEGLTFSEIGLVSGNNFLEVQYLNREFNYNEVKK